VPKSGIAMDSIIHRHARQGPEAHGERRFKMVKAFADCFALSAAASRTW
jgi:hypothetical protein